MNISVFTQCANCGACYNVCPKNAIKVNGDGLFYVPTVVEEDCIDCSLCVSVCPVNQELQENLPKTAYAGWHKDHGVVLDSSSGGVFYGLAQSVLTKGGVVFAAVYADNCKTVCIASSDDVSLRDMMKSKYVESLVGQSFRRIKDELQSNREVLFCGTPCQVAGLHRYLGKKYDSLITCDFVCGGLPSHAIYQRHIAALEKQYCSQAEKVDFRPKTHGWKRYALQIAFKNGKEYVRLGTEDPYLKSFIHGQFTVREYCMDCKFPECHLSDITIADFWLHEKYTSLRNEDGISLVVCNTEKGDEAVRSMQDRYAFSAIRPEEATYNHHLRVSESKKAQRQAFLKEYERRGLSSACNTFLPVSFKAKVKNLMVRKLFRKRRNRT